MKYGLTSSWTKLIHYESFDNKAMRGSFHERIAELKPQGANMKTIHKKKNYSGLSFVNKICEKKNTDFRNFWRAGKYVLL